MIAGQDKPKAVRGRVPCGQGGPASSRTTAAWHGRTSRTLRKEHSSHMSTQVADLERKLRAVAAGDLSALEAVALAEAIAERQKERGF